MMTKHTPGPWRYREREEELISFNVLGGATAVAQVWRRADASLIVAAPDLLAACKYALHMADDDDDRLCNMLAAAIAKAEGGAP